MLVEIVLVQVSSIRNWGKGTLWARKIALKKLLKFTSFFVYLLLKVATKYYQFQQISSFF